MDSFIQGKATRENIHIRRFGYLISAVFLIITGISGMARWPATPWLFLVTMYLLTGSLWIPALIKPFYRLFGKYIIKQEEQSADKDKYLSKN